jgi:hypothetical protein
MMRKRQKRRNILSKVIGIFDKGSRSLKISNTRLPKLYFADAANLLLQYNLKRIEPLSPQGMSGQDEQGTIEFRGEEKNLF